MPILPPASLIGCALVLAVGCAGTPVQPLSPATPPPAITARVMPWRTVRVTVPPGATLWAGAAPLGDLAGLAPYQPPARNLAQRWRCTYRYLPGCDPGFAVNDQPTGWNPLPDLTDGGIADGDTVTNSVWAPGPKLLTVEFDLGEDCLVESVSVLAKAAGGDLRLEAAAGDLALGSITVPAGDGKSLVEPTVRCAPHPARILRLRLASTATAAHALHAAEVRIQGWPDPARCGRVEVAGIAPGGTCHLALRDANGAVTRAAVAVPPLLRADRVDEGFGLNVHLGRLLPDRARIERAADLIAASGASYVRWYPCGGYEQVVDCLRERGVDTLLLSGDPGARLIGVGNEPELKKTTPAEVATRIRAQRERWGGPGRALVGGPTCMAESLDYIGVVMADLRPGELDFYDCHPYVKSSTACAPGFASQEPENVATIYAATRALLARHGHADLPLVASEFGYSTFVGRSWIHGVDAQRQAALLVRSFLANFAEGARLAVWYDFRDDGTSERNMEHRFGVVDHDLQPKPSYRALQAMTRILAGTRVAGRSPGLAPPLAGYECPAADGGRHVTVLFNAHRRSRLALSARLGDSVTLSDLEGRPLAAATGADGRTLLRVDAVPVYAVSRAALGIEELGSEPATLAQALGVEPPATFLVRSGEAALALPVRLRNDGGKTLAVTATCSGDGLERPLTARAELAPGGSATLALTIPASAATAPAVRGFTIELAAGDWKPVASRHFLFDTGRRPLPAAFAVDLNRDGREEVVLESAALLVVVAPAAGGRVLRVLDKRTGADQLFLSPATGGGLLHPDEDLYAGEYLCLGTGFGGALPAAAFSAVTSLIDGTAAVELRAEVDGWEVVHRVAIPAASAGTLQQKYRFTNRQERARELLLRSHPQFTPGGAISFGKVDISIPSGGTVKGNAFMAFRGDVGTLAPDQGWWSVVNRERPGAIRAAFDPAQVAGVRQWHDGEFFNLEMAFQPCSVAPGASATVAYDYAFTPAP